MRIRMAGIDHTTELAIREIFRFSVQEAKAFLKHCLEISGVEEAVLLHTCGRTELWIVGEASPVDLLGIHKSQEMPASMQCLEDDEAVRHLHRTACGLCSQVCGDEQIVTQIREAAEQAGLSCGPVLRQLFRSAVTAGKRARSRVGVPRLPRSVAAQAVEKAASLLGGLAGKQTMVIGSGAMGVLAARHLLAHGATVVMTRRQYHKPVPADIPSGVACVNYDDRYDALHQCDLVIGATSSPHQVIQTEPLRQAIGRSGERPLLLVDIALPRDVEPEVVCLPGVTLIDLDHIGSPALDPDALARMEQEAETGREAFLEWQKARESLSDMEEVRSLARRRMAVLKDLPPAMRRETEACMLEVLETLLFSVKKHEGLDAFLSVSSTLGRAAGMLNNPSSRHEGTIPSRLAVGEEER